jgi:NOL1/NOP2/sun family putative RNA methylase
MKKNPADKLAAKKTALIDRTAVAYSCTPEEAASLLTLQRRQSVRVNPLQGDPSMTRAELDYLSNSTLQPFHWLQNGYTVAPEAMPAIRDSHLMTEGKVYIQNAASWLPVVALDVQAGQDILDVCAAPGGKTSHIAAETNNKARIAANDNSKVRINKLRLNMDRLGVDNISYTLFDAAQLASKMSGRQFDRILLDAPCSGEGMMNLARDKDFDSWSVAHIKRLQQLQKRILAQAWQLLKPGGRLVYSTCTIAPDENEAVIDYLLRHNEDARVLPFSVSLPNRVQPVMEWNGKHFDPIVAQCLRLRPSREIEAFFVCVLEKHAH